MGGEILELQFELSSVSLYDSVLFGGEYVHDKDHIVYNPLIRDIVHSSLLGMKRCL